MLKLHGEYFNELRILDSPTTTTPATTCSSMRICQRRRQKPHMRYDVGGDWLVKTRKRCLRRMFHHPTRSAKPIDNQNPFCAFSSSSVSRHNSRALNSQFARTPMRTQIDATTSVAESVMAARDALKEQHTSCGEWWKSCYSTRVHINARRV